MLASQILSKVLILLIFTILVVQLGVYNNSQVDSIDHALVVLVYFAIGIHIVAVIVVFARDITLKIIQKINSKKVVPNQITTEINMATDKNDLSFSSSIKKTKLKEENAKEIDHSIEPASAKSDIVMKTSEPFYT
jgi:hypothetical protein